MRMKWEEKHFNFLKKYLGEKTPKEITELFNEEFNTNKSIDAIKGAVYYKGWRFKIKPGVGKGNQVRSLPLGSKRLNKDGYVEVKIANELKAEQKNWKLYHHVIWEEKHGHIPDDHVVIFLNRDKNDIRLENLLCIERKVWMRLSRNKMIYDDPELMKAAININKVIVKQDDLVRKK